MTSTNTLSVSELRQNTASVLNFVVGSKTATIIMQRSKPKAALVDIDYFLALEEVLFDLTDSREAEKAKKEPRITFDKYMAKRWGRS